MRPKNPLTLAALAAAALFVAAPSTSLAQDDRNVRTASDAIAEAANRAVGTTGEKGEKGGIPALLSVVAKSDRDRLSGDIERETKTAFDREAERFRKTWKEKYGEEFEATRKLRYFEFADKKVDVDGDRQTAEYRFPSHSGRSAFEIRMYRYTDDGGSPWRIALPDREDGNDLAKSLVSDLKMLNEKSSNWPDKKDDAYDAALTNILHSLAYSIQGKAPGMEQERRRNRPKDADRETSRR